MGQHEIKDAGQVCYAADNQSGACHFLGRVASHGDSTLDCQSCQQQNSEERAAFEPAREHESKSQNQRDSIVSATEANESIGCERESDETARHLQIGVEQRVG